MIKKNYNWQNILLFGLPIILFLLSYCFVIIGLEHIFSIDLHHFSLELLVYILIEPLVFLIIFLGMYWQNKRAGNFGEIAEKIISCVNKDYKTVLFVQAVSLFLGIWNPVCLLFALLVLPVTISGGAFYYICRQSR